MTSEVVIDVQQKDISIALMEDKQLVEYQNEPREASFSVGNIYIAKVKKLMPGLNACFVDVGYERDAFLHYLDLGSHFNSYQKYLKQVQSDRKKLFPFSKASKMPELEKDGSIQNVLKAGQEVLVQIVKEPISTKGPRLTGEISFAGRYLVLMPFGDKVSVSSKIKSGEERSRLKQLIHSIKPKNCGVIVRTVAEGKKVAELDAELVHDEERYEEEDPRGHHEQGEQVAVPLLEEPAVDEEHVDHALVLVADTVAVAVDPAAPRARGERMARVGEGLLAAHRRDIAHICLDDLALRAEDHMEEAGGVGGLVVQGFVD